MTMTKGKPKYPATEAERQQIVTGIAAGLSETRIAKQIGRSRKLVHDMIQKPETQLAIKDERAEFAQICKQKSREIVVSIDAVDIAKANLQQKSISAGILLDKALLLSGEPTSVDVHVLVDAAAEFRKHRRAEGLRHVEEYRVAHGLPAPPAPTKPA